MSILSGYCFLFLLFECLTVFRHEGPIWQVAWAHPKFGSLLASCSYDGTVIIWQESKRPSSEANLPTFSNVNGEKTHAHWAKVKTHRVHDSSGNLLHILTITNFWPVNSISFAPHEFGLHLACASSDGKISVLSMDEKTGEWISQLFSAHQSGCNCVAWCPSSTTSSLLSADFNNTKTSSSNTGQMVLASGGCDNVVKLWKYSPEHNQWILDASLQGHTDWVRDVCWRPNIGTVPHLLVSCSQDNTVLIWHQRTDGQWTSKRLKPEPFADTIWRASFSEYGNLLAVSCGDNTVTIWREIAKSGDWEQVGTVDENVTETVKISEPLAVEPPASVPVPALSYSQYTASETVEPSLILGDNTYQEPRQTIHSSDTAHNSSFFAENVTNCSSVQPIGEEVSTYSPLIPVSENAIIYTNQRPTNEGTQAYSPLQPATENSSTFEPQGAINDRADTSQIYSPSQQPNEDAIVYSPPQVESENANIYSSLETTSTLTDVSAQPTDYNADSCNRQEATAMAAYSSNTQAAAEEAIVCNSEIASEGPTVYNPSQPVDEGLSYNDSHRLAEETKHTDYVSQQPVEDNAYNYYQPPDNYHESVASKQSFNMQQTVDNQKYDPTAESNQIETYNEGDPYAGVHGQIYEASVTFAENIHQPATNEVPPEQATYAYEAPQEAHYDHNQYNADTQLDYQSNFAYGNSGENYEPEAISNAVEYSQYQYDESHYYQDMDQTANFYEYSNPENVAEFGNSFDHPPSSTIVQENTDTTLM